MYREWLLEVTWCFIAFDNSEINPGEIGASFMKDASFNHQTFATCREFWWIASYCDYADWVILPA